MPNAIWISIWLYGEMASCMPAFIFVFGAVKSYFNLFWLLTFVRGIWLQPDCCSCHSGNAAENIAFYFIYAEKRRRIYMESSCSFPAAPQPPIFRIFRSWLQWLCCVRFPFVSFDVPELSSKIHFLRVVPGFLCRPLPLSPAAPFRELCVSHTSVRKTSGTHSVAEICQ